MICNYRERDSHPVPYIKPHALEIREHCNIHYQGGAL
jgi:hypothetical protein